MRISDWSSDVCSSDLLLQRSPLVRLRRSALPVRTHVRHAERRRSAFVAYPDPPLERRRGRSAACERRFLRLATSSAPPVGVPPRVRFLLFRPLCALQRRGALHSHAASPLPRTLMRKKSEGPSV